jgi:hypothetical protein
MADKKISALDAATTPLTGTEVVAIVQSNTTKKVPVADLTTGRALSATQLTLTTGNLIVASGQGIDFSATPGTGTSELLADYEEGLWTPTYVMSGTDFTSVTYAAFTSASYTKTGRSVAVQGLIGTNAITVGSASGIVRIGGLPFTSMAGSDSEGNSTASIGYATGFALNFPLSAIVPAGNTVIQLYTRALSNGATSAVAATDMSTGGNNLNWLYFSATYNV